jgi:hypothetical protein
MSSPGREKIIEAVGDWGTVLEERLKDDPVARAVAAALTQLAGVSIIYAADAKPDWHTDELFAKAAVETALQTAAERTEELTEAATNHFAIHFGPAYEKLLASDPDLLAAAKRVGLATPSGIAKLAHDYGSREVLKLTKERVPTVLALAREPWSVSALEGRLGGRKTRWFGRR